MANRENIRKWVDALRSGNYRQGVDTLKAVMSSDGVPSYCCLGVACELALHEGIVTQNIIRGHSGFGEERNTGSLPTEVQQWLGIYSDNPYIPGIDETLLCLNDVVQLDFLLIADLIEETYLDTQPSSEDTCLILRE